MASARGSIGSGGSIGAASLRAADALPTASSTATRANTTCDTPCTLRVSSRMIIGAAVCQVSSLVCLAAYLLCSAHVANHPCCKLHTTSPQVTAGLASSQRQVSSVASVEECEKCERGSAAFCWVHTLAIAARARVRPLSLHQTQHLERYSADTPLAPRALAPEACSVQVRACP